MEFSVSNPLIEWRGPAPFYLIPMKDAMRKAVGVELGDVVKMKVKLGKHI